MKCVFRRCAVNFAFLVFASHKISLLVLVNVCCGELLL